jgi:hypothetical protein
LVPGAQYPGVKTAGSSTLSYVLVAWYLITHRNIKIIIIIVINGHYHYDDNAPDLEENISHVEKAWNLNFSAAVIFV